MATHDFVRDYNEHVARVKVRYGSNDALKAAVGGEFEAIGRLERALLEQYGLGASPATVVDVGCGSGRLASQLAPLPQVRYWGGDIVPDLVNFARDLAARPDWTFALTDGTKIPLEDQSADFVCFFSVFTHLLHQETFRYLREARRVLKPGGFVLFTFLEFQMPSHWAIFEASLNSLSKNLHLDQFVSRDAIVAWAEHLPMDLIAIHDGEKPHIPLASPITYEDGRTMTRLGHFGQSVAVLRKPVAKLS